MSVSSPQPDDLAGRILALLTRRSHTPRELAELLDRPLPEILQQLRILTDSGIVHSSGEGLLASYWPRTIEVALAHSATEILDASLATTHDDELIGAPGEIPPEVIQSVPAEIAHHFGIVPLALRPSGLHLAAVDVLQDLDPLRFILQRPDITLARVTHAALRSALEQYYPS